MYRNLKIGVGIITYNREDFCAALLKTIPIKKIDHLILVNDGDELIGPAKEAWTNISNINCNYIKNEKNLGVAKSKNEALNRLMVAKCDIICLFEDDMLVLREDVFEKYIDAYLASGIQHFNYGPGSPFNRVQTIQNYDLHNRHLLDQHSQPNPRMIVEYSEDVKIALYEHTVAMFSFFTRKVLLEVGYIDEDFAAYQSWEHIIQTNSIINAGYHPPFWYFADIADSDKYLTEAPGAIENSAIAKNKDEWMKKVMAGRELYKMKVGHYPNYTPNASSEQVVECLKKIKANRC